MQNARSELNRQLTSGTLHKSQDCKVRVNEINHETKKGDPKNSKREPEMLRTANHKTQKGRQEIETNSLPFSKKKQTKNINKASQKIPKSKLLKESITIAKKQPE